MQSESLLNDYYSWTIIILFESACFVSKLNGEIYYRRLNLKSCNSRKMFVQVVLKDHYQYSDIFTEKTTTTTRTKKQNMISSHNVILKWFSNSLVQIRINFVPIQINLPDVYLVNNFGDSVT